MIEIPKLEKETFNKWAEDIIKKYQITDTETLENITNCVATYFDELFETYQISFTDLHPDGIFPFAINRKDKMPKYADEDFFDEFYRVENHIRWTYSAVLTKLYRERECIDDIADCPY